ncbi:MAG: hypothetical protein ACWA5P_01905 [bacterium]
MADWIFDGVNKIIKEPVGTGNTTFDIVRDVYSAWKRWVVSTGSQFEQAFSVEGGTPIGSTGLFTGTTFILINGWKLQAADHDHQVIVNGNIYSDDGIVSTANPTGNSTLFVSSTVGAQGVSTSGSTSVWTTQEKDNIIADTELIKDLSIITSNNTQT